MQDRRTTDEDLAALVGLTPPFLASPTIPAWKRIIEGTRCHGSDIC